MLLQFLAFILFNISRSFLAVYTRQWTMHLNPLLMAVGHRIPNEYIQFLQIRLSPILHCNAACKRGSIPEETTFHYTFVCVPQNSQYMDFVLTTFAYFRPWSLFDKMCGAAYAKKGDTSSMLEFLFIRGDQIEWINGKNWVFGVLRIL